jgi:hypothetical protein
MKDRSERIRATKKRTIYKEGKHAMRGPGGAGSNVKRRGQPFQKGNCFSAIIFLGGNIC